MGVPAMVNIEVVADSLPKVVLTVVIADHTNFEAAATGQILAHLLSAHFSHSPDQMPHVLPNEVAMPSTTRLTLFICTNGLFAQPHVLRAVQVAGNLSCGYVPILAEEGFRFPAASFRDDHRNVAKSVSDDPENLLSLAINIFNEIAVVFQPEQYSSTEQILATKALEIYGRCIGGTKVLNASEGKGTQNRELEASEGEETQNLGHRISM